MYFLTYICVLSIVRTGVESVASGWIIPVYDVRSQDRFAFAEDFLRLVLLEQSYEGGGPFLEYAMAPLDKEGYIINEEGQLVPFRIYKKGNHGAQLMCFLHPRNCRGGFHKRLTGGPEERQPNTIYDIRPKKRNSHLNSNVNERERKIPIFNPNDADIFNPSFRPEEEKPDMTSFVPVELTLLADFHDELLPDYDEQPSLPETHRMTRDPEFSETFKNVNGLMKESRNVNHIHEQYVPLGREIHVKDDSDLRYANTWPAYASDSGVLLDFPPGFRNREKPYSYSPEVDVTQTGSKRFESAYDDASYPFRQRRNR